MAPLVAPLIAGFGSLLSGAGATTVGAGLTSAATAIGGTAGTGFSLGSFFTTILQGGATALTAMGAIQQGQAEAAQLRSQAADARFQAMQKPLEARNDQDSMRRDLLKAVSQNDVVNAASGLDLSFGTPASAREAQKADAATALSAVGAKATAEQQRLMLVSKSLMAQAREANKAGRMKAFGAALDFGIDSYARGPKVG